METNEKCEKYLQSSCSKTDEKKHCSKKETLICAAPSKKKKKRERSTSSDSEERKRKRQKKIMKKMKKKIKKQQRKVNVEENITFDIPLNLMEKSKAMAPMTKDEWEKKQSVVKKVYDESTGRYRLIKGDGEVIEEIVSRDRHKAINQQATKGDGQLFQSKMSDYAKK